MSIMSCHGFLPYPLRFGVHPHGILVDVQVLYPSELSSCPFPPHVRLICYFNLWQGSSPLTTKFQRCTNSASSHAISTSGWLRKSSEQISVLLHLIARPGTRRCTSRSTSCPQREVASAIFAEEQAKRGFQKIATELEEAGAFFDAEEEHQQVCQRE